MTFNMNTIKALVKDEHEASIKYRQMANEPNTPTHIKEALLKMSVDEARHHMFWKQYYYMLKGMRSHQK